MSLAQINGSVFEFDQNKKQVGIPSAIVQIKHGEFTSTDSLGFFSLLTAKKGDTLIFSLTGYKTESVILKSIEKPLAVNLSSGVMLNEVEIAYRTSGTDISYLSAMKLEILNERSLMKAACCNLSESFETNPSIDVNFADAVTGTKQIQMLGLSGQYAQITKENMPYMRGLANGYGLTFIPGTWIKSIQLSKGAGSVVNGFESFTGQINTELHDPATMDKFTFNSYVNQNGRNEYNLDFKQAVTKNFSTNWLAHTSFNPLAEDHNSDGFADIPTGRQYNIMKKWNYENPKTGFEGKWGASYLKDERLGGQISKHHAAHSDTLAPYYIGINNEKWELFSKTGYVFRKKPGTSMGLQLSYLNHDQNNYFGSTIYNSTQKTFYANYIFQGIIKTTDNTYKVGASYLDDDINEKFQLFRFNRKEQVAGAFAELAINRKEKFNMVAGFRVDHHNYYGVFYTPRLHLRYAFTSNSILRLSGGRALRTANIFADNAYLMASNRQWTLQPSDLAMPYGLKPETGWNYGLNFTQRFKINYREAYITIDAYRTDFEDQVVIDLDNPNEILIYNLKGPSYSNTAQFEFNMEPRKRFFVKTAYRYVDTRVTYRGSLLEKPMISTNRAFINFSYETRNEHWQFDFTTQFNGSKRLPVRMSSPYGTLYESRSPDFYNLLGQITYLTKFKRSELHIYLGVENLLNYKQANPIVDAGNPYSKYFDASMVWGPIYGRMIYAGLRFKIKELTWLKFKEDK